MIDGILVLASLYPEKTDREWKVLIGILGIIGSILVLSYPLYSATLLPASLAIVIGAIGLIIGVVHIVRGISGTGYGAWIFGIVSIISGLILIANPIIATLSLLMKILAAVALIGGALMIILELRRGG
ncbi:MAG: hypothetical protein GX880_08385 [Methanomicrobiales archaeon]|nr:hypothetical protein [Methanomicrobiales archaeon]